MLSDMQKRLEYIHSLQDIRMNYKTMTEQEQILEEKVCLHKSENDLMNYHIQVVPLHFMHNFGSLQQFDHIWVMDYLTL